MVSTHEGRAGSGQLEVRVTNRGPMAIDGAVIRVDLATSTSSVQRLVVGSLAGRATRSFVVGASSVATTTRASRRR